jgi:Fe-S-cluster containining protein
MPDIVLENRKVLSTWRVPLSRTYVARFGAPVVTHVDPLIFLRKFFAFCMDCDFCHDACCNFGCDTSLATVELLQIEHGDALEQYTGTSRADWFEPEVYADGDFPGGRFRSTRVASGTCIFKNKNRRGCSIHSYCLENGLDYHDIKPVLCWLFPLTVETGALCPQNVVLEKSLVCVDRGITLYQSQRGEVGNLFGAELVAELDELERQTLADAHAQP